MHIVSLVAQIITEPMAAKIYKQPFQINGFVIFMAIPLGMLAYYFYRQGCMLREMKRVCTIEVPAVITAVRKRYSIDGHFGGRGPHYNADYQYEYDGKTYESHHSIYGNAKIGGPKVGEMVTIRINPFEPTELFDHLAETALQYYITSCVLLGILVWMMTFGQVIMRIAG